MKKFILLLLAIIPSVVYSQDLIMRRDGMSIDCKITKIDTSAIYYMFQRDGRILSSFIDIHDIRSYRIMEKDSSQNLQNQQIPGVHSKEILVDTSKYIKETSKWINLLTYSMRFGKNSNGWSVQYYGFNLKNTHSTIIPIVLGFENFTIDTKNTNYYYQSVKINYLLTGISPFFKINDYLLFNLGINFLLGNESITYSYNNGNTHSVYGFTPSQSIFFIPKSRFGIIVGAGLFEKLLSSDIYEKDFGYKLEIGLKF